MNVAPERVRRAADLLASLVRIDSINPMGRPYARPQPVEREAIETIERWFAPHAGRVALERQACGVCHENLAISLPGPNGAPTVLFESHIDTVPADDWADRGLSPRIEGGRLFGRGACDDKGCLSAMILALLEILEEGLRPPQSIVLLCAGDEEYAQTGILRYLKGDHPPFACAVFGEPTRMSPVVQHKGIARWDVTVHGKSAHTSRPELGTNAITGMVDVLGALRAYQDRLQAASQNAYMSGPTITVTMIEGGRTRNATPDLCTAAIDFRVLPGMDPQAERERVIELLQPLPWRISHASPQSTMPPLSTDPAAPFCQRVLATCREVVSTQLEFRGEPYGTDAAWIGRACPAVVLGPGDIAHAHAVDEHIALDELAQAVEVYKRIMMAREQV